MKPTSKFQRLSAAFAAVAITLLAVWAISDYALPGDDGISVAARIATGIPALAFVTK